MKKKYLTYAGIISAIILVALFVMVFFISSPIAFLLPVFTIDPLNDQDLDTNNFLIMSGRTNLPEKTVIVPSVYPASVSGISEGSDDNPLLRGNAWISRGSDQWNSWNGTVDISSLHPADYLIVFKSITFEENYSMSRESGPLASVRFTVGDGICSGECIRKIEPGETPFIRINPLPEYTVQTTITGTTNLPPGTPLGWDLKEKKGTVLPGGPGYRGTCMVISGTGGINRWICEPVSSIPPGLYQFTVTTNTDGIEPGNRSEKVTGSLEFHYPWNQNQRINRDEIRTGSDKTASHYITIDALPKMNINEKYVISGTTDLSPGEMVFFQICKPDQLLNYNITYDPRDNSETDDISGVFGETIVKNGSGNSNFWVFEFETYFLMPGLYEVNVSSRGPERNSLQVMPDSVSASRYFMLHGGA